MKNNFIRAIFFYNVHQLVMDDHDDDVSIFIIIIFIEIFHFSVMRALGIPTRSVTNFDSAHDTDASMTIDLHFDEEGDVIDGMNDSVW